MTLAPPVRPEAVDLPAAGTGERQRRREERRRLGRQQLLVVLLMILALTVTVAVLAQQWLASSGPANQGLERRSHGILSVTKGDIT